MPALTEKDVRALQRRSRMLTHAEQQALCELAICGFENLATFDEAKEKLRAWANVLVRLGTVLGVPSGDAVADPATLLEVAGVVVAERDEARDTVTMRDAAIAQLGDARAAGFDLGVIRGLECARLHVELAVGGDELEEIDAELARARAKEPSAFLVRDLPEVPK